MPTLPLPHPSSYESCKEQLSLWVKKDELIHSEEEIFEIIDLFFPSRTLHTPKGRGSDCAELSCSENLALSTDFFWQDLHFRTSYFTPEEVGAKALGRAISDLAAAGAEPLGFSLGLMLPQSIGRGVLSSLLRGMSHMSHAYNITLSGGDVSKGNTLGFCITVWGKGIAKNFFLQRQQAKEGDCIFIVGDSGLANTGFHLLEHFGRKAMVDWPSLCLAQLSMQPLIQEGLELAKIACNTPNIRLGLMDVSDGIASDLPKLLGNFGANLTFDSQIISQDIKDFGKKYHLDPESIFLSGGEDYSLLGTCLPSAFDAIKKALPEAKVLGTVMEGSAILRNEVPVTLHGFDHFKKPDNQLSFSGRSSGNAEVNDISITSCNSFSEETISSYDQQKSSIIDTASLAWKKGLLSGFNGNISCRIPNSSTNLFYITGTCVAKNSLTINELALMNMKGDVVSGPEPSSEAELHRLIYLSCPNDMAILHTHPPKLLAISLLLPKNDRLALPLVEAKNYSEKMGFVDTLPYGSKELAAAVQKVANEYEAVWMEGHGLIVHGPSLSYCLALTEELEQIASIHLATLASHKQ